jgi:hypothetical protein
MKAKVITSQKGVIEKFNEGFKLEIAKEFRRSFYYLTNNKDTEITVARNVINKMKDTGLIDSNDDYKGK